MMRKIALFLVVALMLFAACKSTKKLFDAGQYDRAIYSALDDLRKKPDNATAASILPQAYNEAVLKYEDEIAAAKNGTQNVQKMDIIYRSYAALQRMYSSIGGTPAARGLVSPRNYSTELSDAAETAAEYRYGKGMELLDRHDRNNAKKAYQEFRAVESYVKGYKDVEERLQEAYDLALVNVVVNKFEQRFGFYNINGNYFQDDIVNTLNNIGGSYYYKFYGTNDPRSNQVRVDQFMEINVYDIRFGQVASNSYSYNVSKDISVQDDKDPKAKKTVTVTATVNVTRRIIDSRAMMDYRINDEISHRMLSYDRIGAQYTWEKLTGSYTGDSRALSDKDWAIIRGTYSNPPAYDELYRELTRRMMNEFNNRMRNIYGR
jgi:hypothetical protein